MAAHELGILMAIAEGFEEAVIRSAAPSR